MRIEQIATYIPDNPVSNDDLSKVMDTSDEWIVKRTGIKSRNWANESILEMTNKVLAKLETTEFDAIIVTTMSNLNIAPSLSSMCAKNLSLTDCMCIDLNAACSGYVYGLNVAEGLLATGFQNVLLLSVEKMSSIIDKSDRATAILFGDGAVATVLSDKGNKLIHKYNQTNNDNLSLTKFEDEYLKMDGQAVFKFATKTIGDCIANYGPIDNIDYFVFHQANKRIIDNVVRKYKIEKSKVVMNLEHVANTSSSSIPLALSDVELKTGDTVMMIGFGAGLSSGCLVYKH